MSLKIFEDLEKNKNLNKLKQEDKSVENDLSKELYDYYMSNMIQGSMYYLVGNYNAFMKLQFNEEPDITNLLEVVKNLPSIEDEQERMNYFKDREDDKIYNFLNWFFNEKKEGNRPGVRI